MTDPYSTQRLHPARPQKPRNLQKTSIGSAEMAGMDAVGTPSNMQQPPIYSPIPTHPMTQPRRPANGAMLNNDTTPRPTNSRPGRSPGALYSQPDTDDSPFTSRTPMSGDRLRSEPQSPPSIDPYSGLPDRDIPERTPTGTPATTATSAPERHDIIYRLELTDPNVRGTTFRYSLSPFQGLDRNNNIARRELAVMDISSSVSGIWQIRRKNQLRDKFFLEDADEPFEIGKDFIARSHTFPSIRIHSSRVLDVLRSLIQYYPSLGLQLQEPEVFFMYPYRILVYYYDELKTKLQQCSQEENDCDLPKVYGDTKLNKDTHRDLGVVLGYLQPIYDREILPELERHEKGFAKFSSLWLLFKPGSDVFARVKGQLMFFKVLSATREHDSVGESSGPWSIIVWGLYFDGYLLKRQARRFKIHEFHDERNIHTLPIKPVHYLQGWADKKEEFLKRGKKYYNFVCEVPLYRRYDGLVNGDKADRYVGDVIIDPAGYAKESTSANHVPTSFEAMFGAPVAQEDFGIVIGDPPDFGGGPYSKLNNRVCSKSAQLEHHEEYLLLPGHIQGYALGRKQWLAFDLDSFMDRNLPHKPLDNLVIDQNDLELIQSLSGAQKGTHILPWTADFIPGKGQGQVVLLHGPPGVGKTLTCECIAAQMGRPLLCLTVADIGTEETTAEAHLAKYLGLATKWGAIVLIDEAETFLTKRREGDLSRNALVTAFLRALEYYSGMIFLTTNEPGRIDDAVSSRIHLAIEYRSLNKTKRQKIWESHFNQLRAQQSLRTWPTDVPKVKLDDLQVVVNNIKSETTIPDVEQLNLSGRDIRNAFQTAIKLARWDAENEVGQAMMKEGFEAGVEIRDRQLKEGISIKDEQFLKAIKTKFALKRVIENITGMTEAERAVDSLARRETEERP